MSISFLGIAQENIYDLTKLPFDDLQEFRNPAENWNIISGIRGSFSDPSPRVLKGNGILYNDPGKDKKSKKSSKDRNLSSKLMHGDIFLSLDFLLPKGSSSGIFFQGRYVIQLADSWKVKIPHSSDLGGIDERWDGTKSQGQRGIEGRSPRTNAGLAPNLWQHLEIEFIAPRFDADGNKLAPARFAKVVLNGVIIHENVILNGLTKGSSFIGEDSLGPLVLQGDQGPVAFRNMEYALLGDSELKLSELNYDYYEGNYDDFSKLTKDNLTRSGNADAIDINLADNPNAAGLVFKGKFTLEEAAEYQFIVKKIGKAKLTLDDEELIITEDLFQDGKAMKKLEAGEHTFELSYLKFFNWAPSGIGLFVGKRNFRPIALHLPSSLPTTTPAPLITAKINNEPEIIRSFMDHGGKKKTHIISVGSPCGIHYAYDLNQSGLIKTWRGEFLNMTDMWYERGEPQTASPMGSVISFKDHGVLAAPIAENSNFTDTIHFNMELSYKGYDLVKNGYPVYHYQYNDIAFDDLLLPNSDGMGIKRTITFNTAQTDPVYFRVAKGRSIEKVGKGIYAIDDQSYYVKLDKSSKAKPEIKELNGKKELLVQGSSSNTLSYTIIW